MTSTLMEQTYRQLRSRFESGELAPGTQLVNRTLCKELGVSTIPLREAIQRLSSEGLVEHIPNAGAFVRKLTHREVYELFEFRNAMDMFCLERAITKIDEYQLDQLKGICKKWFSMAHAVRDRGEDSLKGEENKTWINLDFKFHDILVEASGNKWLKKTIEDLRMMSLIAMIKPQEMKFSRAVRNCRIHSCIVRGLAKRDLELASYWMKLHGSYGFQILKISFPDE